MLNVFIVNVLNRALPGKLVKMNGVDNKKLLDTDTESQKTRKKICKVHQTKKTLKLFLRFGISQRRKKSLQMMQVLNDDDRP